MFYKKGKKISLEKAFKDVKDMATECKSCSVNDSKVLQDKEGNFYRVKLVIETENWVKHKAEQKLESGKRELDNLNKGIKEAKA